MVIIDLARKSVGELENLVANYRESGNTEADLYMEALRQLEIKRTKGLDLQKTATHVISAARQRRFVSYKDVATVNGCEWSKIHWSIGDHLGLLCEYAHRQGLPLLSAIVINVDFLQTGEMKPESRKGFVDAARSLGYDIEDEEVFLKAQQERVFERYAREATA